MYAIDRGTASVDRLPVAVLRPAAEPLELPAAAELLRRHGERWTVIDAAGGAVVRATHAPAMLWLGRRGQTTVHADGVAYGLAPGQFLVTEAGARLEAGGTRDAACLALALPARATARIAQRVLGATPAEPVLFAGDGEAGELFATDELLRVERALANPGGEWAIADVAVALVARLLERQRRHDADLARTCGRTERHRRHLYARLNRVRLLVARGPLRDYTMRELAEAAHLSVWHFVRSFGRVFAETPHRYLTRIRLESAARMLAGSDESIARIAERHGFENRCAFARLFRAHFGVPASRHRRAQRQASSRGAGIALVPRRTADAAVGHGAAA